MGRAGQYGQAAGEPRRHVQDIQLTSLDSAGQAHPRRFHATPLVREVTDWDDYAGRFEAVDSLELRSLLLKALIP